MRVMVVLVAVVGCDAGVKTDDGSRVKAQKPVVLPAPSQEERLDDVRYGVLNIRVSTKMTPSSRIARDLEEQKIAAQLQVCGRKWLKARGSISASFMVDGQGKVFSLETGDGFSGHCFRPKLERMNFSPGELTSVNLIATYEPPRQDDYLANRELGRMNLNVFSLGLTTEDVVKRLAPARAALEQCIIAKAQEPIINITFVIGEMPDELEFFQPHTNQVKEPCAEAAIRKLNLTVPGGAEVDLSMTFGPR